MAQSGSKHNKSGFELERKPGTTSIHLAYVRSKRGEAAILNEDDVISPTLISELEYKMKKLIKNIELSPSKDVETILNTSRQTEDRIKCIIETMFCQIRKEAEGALIIDALNDANSRVMTIIPKNVDSLLETLEYVEENLKQYAERVIKTKSIKILSKMAAKNRKIREAKQQQKANLELIRAHRLNKIKQKYNLEGNSSNNVTKKVSK